MVPGTRVPVVYQVELYSVQYPDEYIQCTQYEYFVRFHTVFNEVQSCMMGSTQLSEAPSIV